MKAAIIASAIRKEKHRDKYPEPGNPYDVALQFCMERLHEFLTVNDQQSKHTHIVFEKRGVKEDAELARAFDLIASRRSPLYSWTNYSNMTLEARFAGKSMNSTGLQLADLTARPIALKALRPDQSNRAYDIIAAKC